MAVREVTTNGLGTRLREQRERRGFKLAALGKLANVSHSTLSDVENGKRTPTAGLLWCVVPHLWPHRDRYEIWAELAHEAGIPYANAPGDRALPAGDPLDNVCQELARGPWPDTVIRGVTLLLEPWVVNSSGARTVG